MHNWDLNVLIVKLGQAAESRHLSVSPIAFVAAVVVAALFYRFFVAAGQVGKIDAIPNGIQVG